MPTVARFTSAAEAAFFQTLLENQGIPSTLIDNATRLGGIENTVPAAIDVAPEHVEQAAEIYREYSKDNKARADNTEQTHPNKGFPFLGVWIVAALVIFVIYMAVALFSPTFDHAYILRYAALSFMNAIIGGLMLAVGIAFFRMCVAMFRKK